MPASKIIKAHFILTRFFFFILLQIVAEKPDASLVHFKTLTMLDFFNALNVEILLLFFCHIVSQNADDLSRHVAEITFLELSV